MAHSHASRAGMWLASCEGRIRCSPLACGWDGGSVPVWSCDPPERTPALAWRPRLPFLPANQLSAVFCPDFQPFASPRGLGALGTEFQPAPCSVPAKGQAQELPSCSFVSLTVTQKERRSLVGSADPKSGRPVLWNQEGVEALEASTPAFLLFQTSIPCSCQPPWVSSEVAVKVKWGHLRSKWLLRTAGAIREEGFDSLQND